jgi:hypothetical protein
VERNVERLAWTVLIAAFAALWMIAIAAYTGINWYLARAMADRPVKLEILKGTTLWLPSGGRQEVNAGSHLSVAGGEQIRTAEDSEALLSFYDGSNVRLWPNTTIRIIAAKSSAFRSTASEFILTQDTGHARYEVAIPATASRHFEVKTPQADALLRDGSYRVEVAPDSTIVSASSGSATVSDGQRAIEILKGEWTTVATGAPPTPPESDVHNLVENGDFTNNLTGWRIGNRDLADAAAGTVTIRKEFNRTFAEFSRDKSPKRAETFLHSSVNLDVTDFGMLKIRFQLRIEEQDPPGDSGFGEQVPLVARVHYRDSSGSEATWSQGFYAATDGIGTIRNAQPVTRSFWTDVSFDLFDPSVSSPRPAEILWVEFAATGAGFRSDVGNVQVLVD